MMVDLILSRTKFSNSAVDKCKDDLTYECLKKED